MSGNPENRTRVQRIEEVRMGLILAFCLCFLFFIVEFFIYQILHGRIHHDLDQNRTQEVSAMGERIHDIFLRIEVYLVHASNLYSVRQLLKGEDPAMRSAVERFFLKIVEAKVSHFAPTFGQVRLLNLNGMEILRVDLDPDNRARVRPRGQLQDKADRYYVRESMALSENQIYMSPMDLNVEHGRVELPHKPMIRFAIPVFESHGKRVGLLVFNYLAQQILRDLSVFVHKEDQWILLNEDGYYLYGPNPDKNFGFMFPEKKAGFFSDYPDFWELLSTSRGQKFDRPEGIYYRKTINPFGVDAMMTVSNNHFWTFLMFVPKKNIHRQDILLVQGLLMAGVIIVPILFLLGWFLGKARVKNKWYLASLEASATRDGLTGLLNHRAAMDQLEYQMNVAKRYGHSLSLAYIDLDNLKTINDTLGHRKGDQMILLAAESIIKSIRNTDIAARIGGDEFIVILPGLVREGTREVISRIEDSYARGSQSVFQRELTLSWGVSLWEGISDTMESFINRADKEMYKMKKEKKSSGNIHLP